MLTDFKKRNALRKANGLREIKDPEAPVSVAEIRRRNWNGKFLRLMNNRMVMGFYRYDFMHNQLPGQYDCVSSIIERLEAYKKDGNLEHLVDAANISMVEFTTSAHPKKHFRATDDEMHTKRRK